MFSKWYFWKWQKIALVEKMKSLTCIIQLFENIEYGIHITKKHEIDILDVSDSIKKNSPAPTHAPHSDSHLCINPHDSDRLPRLTASVTNDCNCQVPWHERPKWERFPYVSYVLPNATTPWQSHWKGHEHCWIACGCDSDGVLAQELASMEAVLNDDELLLFCSSVQSVLGGNLSGIVPPSSSPREEVTNDQRTCPPSESNVQQGTVTNDGKHRGRALPMTTHSTPMCPECISEDLLSWTSDASASSIVDEEEGVAGSQSVSSESEPSKSEVEDPGTLSESRDGEEASADDSECLLESCPSTPPRKLRADQETPEKGRFLSNDVDGFSSDADSSSCSKDFAFGAYCNESECYAW